MSHTPHPRRYAAHFYSHVHLDMSHAELSELRNSAPNSNQSLVQCFFKFSFSKNRCPQILIFHRQPIAIHRIFLGQVHKPLDRSLRAQTGLTKMDTFSAFDICSMNYYVTYGYQFYVIICTPPARPGFSFQIDEHLNLTTGNPTWRRVQKGATREVDFEPESQTSS